MSDTLAQAEAQAQAQAHIYYLLHTLLYVQTGIAHRKWYCIYFLKEKKTKTTSAVVYAKKNIMVCPCNVCQLKYINFNLIS